MKLLNKTSLYLLYASLIVFLSSGVIIYFFLQATIKEDVNERLMEQKDFFLEHLHDFGSFDQYALPLDSSIIIGPAEEALPDSNIAFSDTFRIPIYDEEEVPFRRLQFQATINEETRIIYLYYSLIETDDLIEAISFFLLIVFVFIFLAVWILNYKTINKIWKPFYQILEEIKIFSFKKKKGFRKIHSDINEFNELNNALYLMTGKLIHNFYTLKEFSENASHEMQTPLAIIQSKLELLMQDKDISRNQVEALNAAYQSTNRLSRLHHDLNL